MFITTALLAGDSFFHPHFSINNFFLDSRFVFILFMIVNILFAYRGKIYVPDKILRLNRRVAFVPLVILSIFFILGNYFIHTNFSLSNFGVFAKQFALLSMLSGFMIYVDPGKKWLENRQSRLIFYTPPLVFFLFVAVQHLLPELFRTITQEGHLIEWVQFIFYVLASLIALRIFLNLKKGVVAVFFLLLALLLFFVAGEEISWGQTILGLQTPETLKQINYQDEITVHNIGIFQAKIYYFYMAIGFYGAFSYLLVRRFASGVFGKFKLIFPHPQFCFYFLAVFVSYFYDRFIYFYDELFTMEMLGFDSPGKWQEVAEGFLSVGLFLFALYAYRNIDSSRLTRKRSSRH